MLFNNHAVCIREKRPFMIFLLFLFLLLTVPLPEIRAQMDEMGQYRYISRTGETSEEIRWSIQSGSPLTIVARQNDVVFTNSCGTSGETVHWTMQGPESDVTAERKNNTLILRGRISGKAVKKKFTLDSSPWYQPLTYSLRNFLASGRNTEYFWIIRLDKLEAIKMKAAKKCIEHLSLNGKTTKTQAVVVRPAGLFSLLWHGTYWYRTSDFLFVQYQGRNGPPGTPLTTIRLLEP